MSHPPDQLTAQRATRRQSPARRRTASDDPLDGLLLRIASEAKSPRAQAWARALIVDGEYGASGEAAAGVGPDETGGGQSPPAAPRRRKRSAALT
jgi:hypothetical protein